MEGYREEVIDSHCHLTRLTTTAATDDIELADVLDGLAAVVSVGTGVDDCEATLELAARSAKVFVAVGIHPNSASEAD